MKHSLQRILVAGWTNFKRNSYLSIAVTGVMALVLVLFLGIISFQFLTVRLVHTIEDKVDISAYFKIETATENILALKADLEKLPEVSEVTYVSRAQALEDFKAKRANDPKIQEALQLLDDNPIEATLNIKAIDPTQYGAIATFLENTRFQKDISVVNYNDNKDLINRINRISSAIQSWGLISAIVIAIIAILITFNTIRLTIYNQKQEIEIMRLVGASNWHIRGPYLSEGALYGSFAALIALIVFYPILYGISDKLESFIPGVNLLAYFIRNGLQIILICWITGVLLGILSSIIAMRKHLKI